MIKNDNFIVNTKTAKNKTIYLMLMEEMTIFCSFKQITFKQVNKSK